MANGIKTALLLGLMSGVLLALGELLGGANGLVIAFVFAGDHEFRIVLVLGQDRPEHVPRAAGGA